MLDRNQMRPGLVQVENLVGQQIGNYRVLSRIGEGGMGFVYLAQHTLLKRKAAIKVLRPECAMHEKVVKRFFNEAKATASLDHPGLVELLDVGYHAEGWAYLIMEFLDGESLGTRLIGGKRLPVAVAAHIAKELADILAVVHTAGIIHRDLKPENIFLMVDPARPYGLRVKIIDFGIAKLYESQTTETKDTQTGVILGSPPYMSPEQCDSATSVDGRADIYSLGCVLFEMLGGEPPFVSRGRGQILIDHITKPPRRLRAMFSEIPLAVDEAVDRMLAKKPEDRFQSMEEVSAALAAIVPSLPSADEWRVRDGASGVYVAYGALHEGASQASGSLAVGETLPASAVEANLPHAGPRFPLARLARRRKTRGRLAVALGMVAVAAVTAVVWFPSRKEGPSQLPAVVPEKVAVPSAAPQPVPVSVADPTVAPTVAGKNAERATESPRVPEAERSTRAPAKKSKRRPEATRTTPKSGTSTSPPLPKMQGGVLDPFAE